MFVLQELQCLQRFSLTIYAHPQMNYITLHIKFYHWSLLLQFSEVIEEYVCLALGPEFTSWGRKWTHQDRVDSVLSSVPPCTPVACLIHSESDEETVARILMAVAEEKGLPYHHLEMGEMDDDLLKLEGWCSEGGWAVIGYSYLQSSPQRAWQQLSKVANITVCVHIYLMYSSLYHIRLSETMSRRAQIYSYG